MNHFTAGPRAIAEAMTVHCGCQTRVIHHLNRDSCCSQMRTEINTAAMLDLLDMTAELSGCILCCNGVYIYAGIEDSYPLLGHTQTNVCCPVICVIIHGTGVK